MRDRARSRAWRCLFAGFGFIVLFVPCPARPVAGSKLWLIVTSGSLAVTALTLLRPQRCAGGRAGPEVLEGPRRQRILALLHRRGRQRCGRWGGGRWWFAWLSRAQLCYGTGIVFYCRFTTEILDCSLDVQLSAGRWLVRVSRTQSVAWHGACERTPTLHCRPAAGRRRRGGPRAATGAALHGTRGRRRGRRREWARERGQRTRPLPGVSPATSFPSEGPR